jgi:hypothetical protein
MRQQVQLPHNETSRSGPHTRVEPNGYCFVPFSMETYRPLGHPAMKLLHVLGDEAAVPGGITQTSFVSGTLRKLSIRLCRSKFLLYRTSVGTLARASRMGYQAGVTVPIDKHVV